MMTTMTVVAMGGLGILTVAFVASVAFRRASASLRHLVWLAALSATLALPLLEGVGVELRLDVPEALALAWAVPGPVEAADAGDAGETGLPEGAIGLAGGDIGIARGIGDAAPRALDGPDDVEGGAEGPAPGLGDATRRTVEPAVGAGAAASDHAATVLPPPAAEEAGRGSGSAALGAARSDPVGRTPGFWAPSLRAVGLWAVGLWAFGALVLLLGTLVRSRQARSLTVRDVTPASPRSLELAEAAQERLGLHRPVRIVVSGRIDVPATWGVLRPTVLLPRESTRWSDDTLHRVLLHELAHVQRGDCAAYLVGELARAVHWPNPLAWLAVRCLRVESERAADDRVVEVTDLPSAYAGDLVSMLRSLGRRAPLPSAALAMARPSGLSVRIRAILDPRQARGRVGRPAATVVASVASILALAATVVTPVADAQEADAGPVVPEASAPSATAGDGPMPRSERPAIGAKPVRGAAPLRGAEALRTSAREPASAEALPSGPMSASTPSSTPQERICAFRRDRGSHFSTHVDIDDDEVQIRWETDDCRVKIDIEGPVVFSADDRGIVSLAPDGLFEIEERIGRVTRRARIEGRSDGGLERRYWDDGDEIAWGPEADRWLAGLLPQVFRHSTINADARVRRMLDDGGPERVFDEVEQIRSDHVARTYLQIMMEATELDEDGYRRVIQAAAAIDSDHSSAELMMSVIDRAGLRPAFQDPLLAASERLDSDHQRSRVLRALLESPLSASQLDAVLRSASSMDSDHRLGDLLSLIARAGRLDDAGRVSFLQALGSIESDHQQARVIHAFLDSGTLTDDELATVLAMSDDIDSDHQRAEVLQRVARDYPLTGAQVTAYLQSAARIGSDHQKASTAEAIIERADFDAEQLELVLRIATDIDSDHQMARVLGRVVQRRELSQAEVSQLVSVSRRIDSDHQLSELLSLLVRERPLGDEGLVAVLEVAEGIDSSHQRAELLLRVANRYELEGRARDLYRSLADDLSRRDRERALAAIVR